MNNGYRRTAAAYAVATLILAGFAAGAQAQMGRYSASASAAMGNTIQTPDEIMQQACDDAWDASEASNYCSNETITASDDDESTKGFQCTISADCSYTAEIHTAVYNGEDYVRTDVTNETWTYALNDTFEKNDVSDLHLCVTESSTGDSWTVDVQTDSECAASDEVAIDQHTELTFTRTVYEYDDESTD